MFRVLVLNFKDFLGVVPDPCLPGGFPRPSRPASEGSPYSVYSQYAQIELVGVEFGVNHFEHC